MYYGWSDDIDVVTEIERRKDMIEKIKEFKNDAEEVYEGIEETLSQAKFWPVWYFLKVHIIGCVIIYWLLTIGAGITHKKWDLVDRES